MATILTGDLFQSPAQTLVNPVNTVGVMGKGIALRFQSRIHPWIVNFPTKNHWRSAAQLPWIIEGLEYLLRYYQE